MESLFRPPEPLVVDGNIADNWRKFNQKFDVFLLASGLDKKPEETRVAVFLNLIGDEGLELYNSFTFTAEELKSLDSIKKKFQEYCSPQENVIFERFKFNSIGQKEGQTFDSFLTELRKAVKTTGYTQPDEMIRDRVVMGIFDKNTQERLLREPKLTLTKTIDFCRATEASKTQSKILQNELQVDAIRGKKHSFQNSYKKTREKTSTTSSSSHGQSSCKFCGYKHIPNGKCPAYGKTCAACQGRNHFAVMCPDQGSSKSHRSHENSGERPSWKKSVHELEEQQTTEDRGSDSSSESESFYVSSLCLVDSVESRESNKVSSECYNRGNQTKMERDWRQVVQIENKRKVNFKLDTGAEVSVLPLHVFRELQVSCNLKSTKVMLVSYGCDSFRIKPQGEVSLSCEVNNRKAILDFLVIDSTDQLPLLGLSACIKLKLIQRLASINPKHIVSFKTLEDVKKMYASVFDGLGQFPTEHHISLKKDVVPHIQPPRRVPRALHDRLKLKLEQLEAQGVIKKIEEPTEWLNPLVIVEKSNGDLRLCLDPKYLNKAIQREHFLIPTSEEIAVKLCNKEYFSVLDMKDGYFQIKIDSQSSKYTAFGTPFGRFEFLRLPFGICSAPEVFQRKNYEIFGDLAGVGLYFDDLVITGENELEHDHNLQLVLERALKYNIKFNSSKIQFKSKSVKFMGQIYSKAGVQPNKIYVKAILDLPQPKNKNDLLRVLGMAKYLGKFVPNMSKISAPLRELTRLDCVWNWQDIHEQSLFQLKQLLTSAPVLKFFDSKKEIEIETDASKDGLGACLLQEGHPVAFASRSLTPTEQKYAQIEKEMLAIVFAIQKFHFFIYGLKIKVNSDHKPLETIIKKDLATISPRLQRMRLKLLDYDLEVHYKPGKYLYIADTLSRAYLFEKGLKSDREFHFAVHSVIKNIPMAAERKLQFKKEIQQDSNLKLVVDFCMKGWPENKNNLPDCIRHYHKIKENLTFSDGLLLFNTKLVVPTSLRQEMLTLLHEGHIGLEKCKNRARQIFYWPGINTDIETIINKCKLCEANARKQQKESLHSYVVPERPWERLGLDIFTYANKSYLIAIDSYSNWLELRHIKDKSIKSVIKCLKNIFSVFGSPDVVTCDNIPFDSFDFKAFAKEWNFKIVTRSPNYPRSNGLAEKGVGIGKSIVKKAIKGEEEVEYALLQYRNSPLKNMGYSPSQLLMSRICKTKIPIISNLLEPRLCEDVARKLENKQTISRKYFNRNSKDLLPLKPNSDITMYNHVEKKWEPGLLIKQHESPRSYLVQNQFGDILRRNRIDLRPSLNKLVPTSSDRSDIPNMIEQDSDNNVNSRSSLNEHVNSDVPVIEPGSDFKTTRFGRVVKPPKKLNL